MWRFVFIAFLIAHGGVHVAIWATPKPEDQKVPFDASHSWRSVPSDQWRWSSHWPRLRCW
jgi:hypothetical protein